jgi:hypothetical protein
MIHRAALALLMLGRIHAADFDTGNTASVWLAGAAFASVIPHNPYVCAGGGLGTVDVWKGEVGAESMFASIAYLQDRRPASAGDRDEHLFAIGPGFVNVIQLHYLRSETGAEGARIVTNIPFFYLGDDRRDGWEMMKRNWPFHGLMAYDTNGAAWCRLHVQRMAHFGIKETQVGLELGVSLW